MDIQDIDSLIGNAVNPIFKRSLAKGGPIFGEDHPYFTVDKRFIQPMKAYHPILNPNIISYE